MSAVDRPVSGPQKVAAFLLSLDKVAAASVLKTLDAKVVADVAAAMAELDESFRDRGSVDALYRELARTLNVPKLAMRSPDDQELAAFLEAGLGRERSAKALAQIHERRRHERPFAALEKHPAAALGRVLLEESPAVSALVLAHLAPPVSAEILSSFPPEHALEVVQRISKLIPPGFETLSGVAAQLETRMIQVAAMPAPPDPKLRLKTIAQMLTHTQSQVEKAVLEGLDMHDRDMAQEIREFMFTWDDLAGLDRRAMQKVLSSVETRLLSITLKACPKAVEENIMANLSVRVRAMVAEERDLAGAMPMAEVLAARAEMLKTVRGLLESGEFAPARASEELVS